MAGGEDTAPANEQLVFAGKSLSYMPQTNNQHVFLIPEIYNYTIYDTVHLSEVRRPA